MLAHLSLALLLLLPLNGRGDDSVASSVGRHTMGRIADLLSPSECHQLQAELNSPDEELEELEELVALSQEENPAPHRRRRRRGIHSKGCSEALRLWLVTTGETTTWDRLVRALHQIGRSDIARELGKNLNQDRSLELKRNVEGYSRSVQHLSSAQLQPRGRRAPLPGEMLFERQRPSRYSRGLLGWLRPLVLGVLGAFVSSVLLTGTAMYFCHWRRLLVA
ncbi:hypothetical protein HGM15179_017764 [Zosterops borbonicus]|uniref:Death domain-containing protein n=1 Tax=Zosterops borbonicus TaxID=364589 RepID=A0A8K1G0E0_9PASS|nr:hypothetical protein HGM15179_017764 [Zosterops borbonicus]